MSAIKILDVDVDILGSLDVDVEFGKTIVKNIGGDLYSGPFEFYPSGEVQVVPIGGKTSTKDVIFKAVEGSLEITENGSYDVTNLSGVDISIEPTVTTYTTGEYLDAIRANLEANTGKGTFTFVYKASEATTYNGTSYSAGDTILTSTPS